MAAQPYFTDQPSANESGALAALWRKLLVNGKLLPGLDYFVNMYMENSANGTLASNKAFKRKSRSTLNQNIYGTEMTIKTLLDLLFNLLRAKKVTITISVELPGREQPIMSHVELESAGSDYNEEGGEDEQRD